MENFSKKSILFTNIINDNSKYLNDVIKQSKFLILGAAGTIGRAVTKEIFSRDPRLIHAVDISENNLVELVRDLRSSKGYISGEFKTFAISVNSPEFYALLRSSGDYDYILNLSALKHVRSEKDPYTLMRMTLVNVINNVDLLRHLRTTNLKNFFCVSTDKATEPVNMMGASKRIMELFLMSESEHQKVSMARFANVAYSDGSLLHGFVQRYLLEQPLSAPRNIRRYFMSQQEAGQLCLLTALLAQNREIYFPKLDMENDLISFTEIAVKFLESKGFTAHVCDSEHEARTNIKALIQKKRWPVYFFDSDTSGEKDQEIFWSYNDKLILNRYDNIGVIVPNDHVCRTSLKRFERAIQNMLSTGSWTSSDLIKNYRTVLPDFNHHLSGKFLDDRM